ncbi:MAG: hypothetical protein ABSG22_00390 [Sedimentisphaerales bacterium]
MRTVTILLSFLVLGLVIGWLIWFLVPQLRPEYTAETFIRVLPGTEKGSTVTLIRHKNTLESLIDRDKIQQTEWFQGLGKTKDERLRAGVSDLKRRFRAKAIRSSDLIKISMTCGNSKDASVIVNEMADMFLRTQLAEKHKQITSHLMFLDENQVRLQRDLDLAGSTLDDVRRRYGFTDLEQHDYPHPITTRLIRLQNQEDDCALNADQLQTHRDALLSQPQQLLSSGKSDPNQTGGIKDLELKIKLAQSRLAGLRKMREETEKKQEELEKGRIQYIKGKEIRDNRQTALDAVRAKIEELRSFSDNPDVSGLQLVDYAKTPQTPDTLPWQIPVPAAGAAGLFLGIICALLTGKTRKPN